MNGYHILKSLSLILAAITTICYFYQAVYLFLPKLK